MLRQIWFQTHWFVGITAGSVLALVGVTGAMLSFEHEIIDWLNRDVRTVQPLGHSPASPSELVARIQEDHPDKRITGLAVSADPSHSARVTFAAGDAASGGSPGRGPRGEPHYVNPYTGDLIAGSGERGEGFFRTTMQIHRWLTAGSLGNRDAGKQIVGACTVLLIVLALSGLYLRWPRHPGRWRAWLALDFRLQGRRFLWHLHAVAGTWVLVLYLIMALSGLYWSYDWYRSGLYALAGVEPPVRGRPPGPPQRGEPGGARSRDTESPSMQPDIAAAWSSFLQATRESGYSTAILNLAQPAGSVEIRYLDADPSHERAFNTFAVSSRTGEVVRHERYADKSAGGKFMSSIFPLHSGSFFGTPGVIAFMLASLTMPLFAITGWMLYLDRRKSKRAARGVRDSPAAAQSIRT